MASAGPGAIYRVLALAALHHHVDAASEDALVPLASHLDVRFVSTNGNLEVILEGEDAGSAEIVLPGSGECCFTSRAFPRVFVKHYCVANARFANYQA